MWIPKTISAADKAAITVTSADIASGDNVTPYGIAYLPPKDEKAVCIQIGNTNYMLGVCKSPPIGIERGEIGLYSSGGASIVLKNDGRVLINGREPEFGNDSEETEERGEGGESEAGQGE